MGCTGEGSIMVCTGEDSIVGCRGEVSIMVCTGEDSIVGCTGEGSIMVCTGEDSIMVCTGEGSIMVCTGEGSIMACTGEGGVDNKMHSLTESTRSSSIFLGGPTQENSQHYIPAGHSLTSLTLINNSQTILDHRIFETLLCSSTKNRTNQRGGPRSSTLHEGR